MENNQQVNQFKTVIKFKEKELSQISSNLIDLNEEYDYKFKNLNSEISKLNETFKQKGTDQFTNTDDNEENNEI